jgi:hypothetical protein
MASSKGIITNRLGQELYNVDKDLIDSYAELFLGGTYLTMDFVMMAYS